MILSFFKHNPRDPTRRVICPSLHAKNRDTANRFPVVVIVVVPSVGTASTSGMIIDRAPPPPSLEWPIVPRNDDHEVFIPLTKFHEPRDTEIDDGQ